MMATQSKTFGTPSRMFVADRADPEVADRTLRSSSTA